MTKTMTKKTCPLSNNIFLVSVGYYYFCLCISTAPSVSALEICVKLTNHLYNIQIIVYTFICQQDDDFVNRSNFGLQNLRPKQ